jgi:hypothetical protein
MDLPSGGNQPVIPTLRAWNSPGQTSKRHWLLFWQHSHHQYFRLWEIDLIHRVRLLTEFWNCAIPCHHRRWWYEYPDTCRCGCAHIQQCRHGRADGHNQPRKRKVLYHIWSGPLRLCHDRLGMGSQPNHRCPRAHPFIETRSHQACRHWLLSQWKGRPRCRRIRAPYCAHHPARVRLRRCRLLAYLRQDACQRYQHSNCL